MPAGTRVFDVSPMAGGGVLVAGSDDSGAYVQSFGAGGGPGGVSRVTGSSSVFAVVEAEDGFIVTGRAGMGANLGCGIPITGTVYVARFSLVAGCVWATGVGGSLGSERATLSATAEQVIGLAGTYADTLSVLDLVDGSLLSVTTFDNPFSFGGEATYGDDGAVYATGVFSDDQFTIPGTPPLSGNLDIFLARLLP
jgi:hypothetical protein